MLALISDKLNMPVSYFMREVKYIEPNPIFWRGKSTATREARDRAEIRLVWLREIIDYLAEYFDYPSLNLPNMHLPREFPGIDTEMLDLAASVLRSHYSVGAQQMPHLR